MMKCDKCGHTGVGLHAGALIRMVHEEPVTQVAGAALDYAYAKMELRALACMETAVANRKAMEDMQRHLEAPPVQHYEINHTYIQPKGELHTGPLLEPKGLKPPRGFNHHKFTQPFSKRKRR